ncbi:microviridin/marinostatin family tricyclic proteinase inhibitor [Chryseobacterium carnipullorum]|uniref:microviridin/marinostatin family tricyclic proteinase inhibitor n=1 Tax=Chryseobacterium carnipullorum TaxID=1124835 RepID=UPI000E85FC85|nr:microviridin/marinostatin family tricyclic proteinase inhibitor [Chryseobacterium carnipullorum]HBV16613.1 serine endopeptidase [Chryseobacterium carnipullorum]
MEKKNSKKPFFASFLEKQIKDPEAIQGGAVTTPVTDLVTLPTRDTVSTSPLIDNATLPVRDQVVTLKYPSDSDESGELEIL